MKESERGKGISRYILLHRAWFIVVTIRFTVVVFVRIVSLPPYTEQHGAKTGSICRLGVERTGVI